MVLRVVFIILTFRWLQAGLSDLKNDDRLWCADYNNNSDSHFERVVPLSYAQCLGVICSVCVCLSYNLVILAYYWLWNMNTDVNVQPKHVFLSLFYSQPVQAVTVHRWFHHSPLDVH